MLLVETDYSICFDSHLNLTFSLNRLMRYCCSAYGRQTMEAADMIAEKNDSVDSSKYTSTVGSEALKQQVCDHVGIPTNYISYFCMGHGGSRELLR